MGKTKSTYEARMASAKYRIKQQLPERGLALVRTLEDSTDSRALTYLSQWDADHASLFEKYPALREFVKRFDDSIREIHRKKTEERKIENEAKAQRMRENIKIADVFVEEHAAKYGNTTIHDLLLRSYDNACEWLKKKYGTIQEPYFLTESCKSPNPRIKRSREGLVIHHIDEDKAVMLSETSSALSHPWEYQKGERLVYANILEHLILHQKIYEKTILDGTWHGQGVGGVFNFMVPELNDIYSGYKYTVEYKDWLANPIREQKNLYYLILKYIKLIEPRIRIDDFCQSFHEQWEKYNWTDENNEKIYKEIREVLGE